MAQQDKLEGMAERWLLNLADSLDPDITEVSESEKVFVGVQEQRDFKYLHKFAKRQLRILHREQGTLVPFRFNWIQRQIFKKEYQCIKDGIRPRFIILKYRRGGVTSYVQARHYQRIWAMPHKRVLTFAHRSQDTRVIFDAVRTFYENQPSKHRHERTPALTYQLAFEPWHSEYSAGTAQATSSGRGSRLDGIHLSEAAFYPNLLQLHMGINDTAAPDAYYYIESTPNGKLGQGEQFYEFWKTAEAGQSSFVPLFFPWHADPRNVIELREPTELEPLEPEEIELMMRHGLRLPQIKWWRSKRRELDAVGRNSRAIFQEHPNDPESCFLESGDAYYGQGLVEASRQLRQPLAIADLEAQYDPMLMPHLEFGRMRIWDEPKEGRSYSIGVDSSEGVGRDDQALTVIDTKSGEQVCAFNWNMIPPDEFGATILPMIGRMYGTEWNPAYIVCEKENHGHAVLGALLHRAQYPHQSVYHHTIRLHKEGREAKIAGWPHNKKHHLDLTYEIGRMLREQWPIIRDAHTLASIRQVVADPNGGAEFGGCDLAVAIGLAALGIESARGKAGLAYIGGRVIDIDTQRVIGT